MGATLLIVLAVVKLLEKLIVPIVMQRAGKWYGQANGTERRSLDVVTLDPSLKEAIYSSARDGKQLREWHEPEDGIQSWKGALLLIELKRGNETMTKLVEGSVETLVVLKQIAANGNRK